MERTGGLSVFVPPRQWPAALALRGPGHLGREGAEAVLIFNASQAGRSVDLLAKFVAEEAGGLDWLDDYLRDVAITDMIRREDSLVVEEEVEDEVFYKNMAISVEMDES